ncbi:threonine/serine ThrE exporter family protein [Lactobacillus sp. PV037]|uniref:threonine/serine ThrE exporter family protein n=1 Tax=Lactobacillus sp. PV037 TaxID=2594496 RepID=UPI00223EC161|nr:threonine/serine exporter family protein [Lactobacillus sp. PV037]
MTKKEDEQRKRLKPQERLSHHHHMRIRWKEFFTSDNQTAAKDATLSERAVIVGHIGMMFLSYGTGAWRVRTAMNTVARKLNMTCSADIGLVSLEYTCVDRDGKSYTQALSLPSTGVNTTKLHYMSKFVYEFENDDGNWTIGEIHQRLTKISRMKAQYTPWQVGLAAALACGGFTFLLGGGIVEVICAFLGAGVGNYVRRKMIDRRLTIVANIIVAVTVASCVYVGAFYLLRLFIPLSKHLLDGYIGAMLFVIPGFPFITSGLDMSKLDMRSGLERMAYALMIILIATSVGWGVAMILNVHPQDFLPLNLGAVTLTILRLIASFCGVFGFSIMFNSKIQMATAAGLIGAIANTLRLSLVQWINMPAAAAAFIGAFIAGMLASFIHQKIGYPRIAITVPSIVIMVPGLYMYRAMFNFGFISINIGARWAMQAIMIIFCLPLGLIVARILTDKHWRHAG